MGFHENNNLSGICRNVCLEPLYTGRCKDECLKRYTKAMSVKSASFKEAKDGDKDG